MARLIAGLRGGLLALVFGAGWAHAAEPVQVYAAGSLAGVLPKLIAASGVPPAAVAPPVFGPAGTLRRRLQAGESADLFASADLAQPRALGAATLVVPFARNRMCVVARDRVGLGPGLTGDALLDRLLSPEVRLATSTPVADPGGDYARAVFARAEAVRPGAEAALVAKSLMLLGGPGSMAPPPGRSPAAAIFLEDRADALLYYCSGAAGLVREVPGLVSVPVPEPLAITAVYGLTVLSDRPEAMRLALFMVSEQGQSILAAGGLLPVTGP